MIKIGIEHRLSIISLQFLWENSVKSSTTYLSVIIKSLEKVVLYLLELKFSQSLTFTKRGPTLEG